MIIVTGATGHIGNVLVRKLLEKGYQVRILNLPGEDLKPLDGLNIEIVEGNVLDPVSLEKAFKGVAGVFHLAGIIKISPGNKDFLYKVNVQGVKNVIAACIKTGVKRLIYTSSVHAFVEPAKNGIINEDTPIDPKRVRGHYAKSKAMATLEIIKAVKEKDLDAVIVCPSGVIGPYDYKISEMGQMILHFLQGKLKAYITGQYNFVDVRDVATGIILAYEKGKKGEIYMLSGNVITIKEFLKMLEKFSTVKAPTFKLQAWFAIAMSPFSNLHYWLRKQRPLFSKYSVQTLASNCNISNNKAKNELGFSVRPAKDSVKDSIRWFEKNLDLLNKK